MESGMILDCLWPVRRHDLFANLDSLPGETLALDPTMYARKSFHEYNAAPNQHDGCDHTRLVCKIELVSQRFHSSPADVVDRDQNRREPRNANPNK